MSTATGLTRVPSSVNGPSTSIGWESAMAPSPRSMDSNPRPVVAAGSGAPNWTVPVLSPTRAATASLVSPVAVVPSMVSSSCAPVPPPMAILGAVPARRATGATGATGQGGRVSGAGRSGRGRRVTGRDTHERRAEEDPGDGDGDRAFRPESTHEGARRRGGRAIRDDGPLARRDQPGCRHDRGATVPNLAGGGATTRLHGGGVRDSRRRWAVQTSKDALDTDRCVEQYGLLEVDGPATLGVAQGLGVSRGTVRGPRYRAGVSPRGRNPVDAGLRHQGEP